MGSCKISRVQGILHPASPNDPFYINVVQYQKQETDIYAILLTTFCLVRNSQGFKSTHTHNTHVCVCFHAI